MIKDISSHIGLLPLSNVHPLSVTDLLQREDCCCYKREDLLKMKRELDKITDTQLDQVNIFQKLQALTIASCEDSESLSSLSAREPHAFLSELLTVFTLQRLSSSEALSLCYGLRISLERTTFNFVIVLYFFCSL